MRDRGILLGVMGFGVCYLGVLVWSGRGGSGLVWFEKFLRFFWGGGSNVDVDVDVDSAECRGDVDVDVNEFQ